MWPIKGNSNASKAMLRNKDDNTNYSRQDQNYKDHKNRSQSDERAFQVCH